MNRAETYSASLPTDTPFIRDSSHAVSVEDVFTALNASRAGLEPGEALHRLERYGPNRLTPRRGRGPVARFLLQFHNVLIYILLLAAVVTALLQHWVDTGVILGVVLINAIVGFVQEGKAERALEAIRRMLSLRATVVRAGRHLTLPAEELVPGDVVVVQSGDRVPADLRLFRVKNLRIDEASLTGESLPVEKTVAEVAAHAPLGDRLCMAYSGTLVTYGQGSGVVVATGDHTELGRISEMLEEAERIETPLLRRIRAFGWWLSGAILLLAAGTFIVGTQLRDYSVQEMFLAAVSLAVAAIPEGLPAIITIALAIGVQRMARRQAIIRVLPAVEALGSVTCICSDKTGTLTRNEMTVQSVATAEHDFNVTGAGYAPHGEFLRAGTSINGQDDPLLEEVLRAGLLCNDASVRELNAQWVADGDPTEAALVVAAMKAGLDPLVEAERRPRRDIIPFESEHRFMATLHHDHTGHAFAFVKGAPERVFEMCRCERYGGADRPLQLADWHERIEAMAARGQRVLALASKPMAPGTVDLNFDDVSSGLALLGLCGMVDPPREEAIGAVARCRQAGIRVKMITGDHAVTARAIAAQLGIGDGTRVINGTELDALSDDDLRRLVPDVDVYARVSPEHKLRLVMALQERGEVVAMTGDGVNDAPALKRADVGVAMGINGTEVAKEAAEIVLADDNFASIVNAVEEGRRIYDNLRKTVVFMLPTNVAEAFTLIAAIVMGIALPILPVQILWINMISAVTLSLALIFEPLEAGTMQRPPRDPRAALISGYFLWRTLIASIFMVGGTLGVFLWQETQGAALEVARTSAVNTLVLFEAFYLLSARYLMVSAWPHLAFRENPYVPWMILLVVILQLLYTYAPVMQSLFHSTALSLHHWIVITIVAASVYVYVELEKIFVRAMTPRMP